MPGYATSIGQTTPQGTSVFNGVIMAATTEIGPQAVATQVVASTVLGRPRVWNGTSWARKNVRVWNGSTWVDKPMKQWDGSTWRLLQ